MAIILHNFVILLTNFRNFLLKETQGAQFVLQGDSFMFWLIDVWARLLCRLILVHYTPINHIYVSTHLSGNTVSALVHCFVSRTTETKGCGKPGCAHLSRSIQISRKHRIGLRERVCSCFSMLDSARGKLRCRARHHLRKMRHLNCSNPPKFFTI